jgi:hypothetical protein
VPDANQPALNVLWSPGSTLQGAAPRDDFELRSQTVVGRGADSISDRHPTNPLHYALIYLHTNSTQLFAPQRHVCRPTSPATDHSHTLYPPSISEVGDCTLSGITRISLNPRSSF